MIAGATSPRVSFIQSVRHNAVFREMLKFMCVGFLSLAMTMVIFNVSSDRLYHVIEDGKLRLLAANAIAFAITLTSAFFLNARFTFAQRGADSSAYFRYFIVNVVGFVLTSGLLVAFTWLLASLRSENINEMHAHFHAGETIALLGAAGCTFFWNFFMSRIWVFRSTNAAGNRKTLVQPQG